MGDSAAIQIGDVVAGKFRVERVIGEGAMGLVVEAMHLQLDERVALKFLRTEALGNADVVARFAQEARAAAKLKSEHVARVLDVGDHQSTPYMVLELLEGQDLESLVNEQGKVSPKEAAELVIQACEAISEAHARGIIHRDIKPANLFLARRADGWSTLKVLDFGISKAGPSAAKPASRRTVSMVGSPYYMSPEQIRSATDVDRRTDVWSLGAVLFELLAGDTAFGENDLGALMAEILDRPHKELRGLRPEVPPELEAVVNRCLSKDPADRYQNAAALAIDLLPFTESKRARVTVTRAVTITRTSGIDPDLPLPSTLPGRPAADSSPSIPLPGKVPSAPASRPSGALGSSSAGAFAKTMLDPSTTGSEATAQAAPAPSRRGFAMPLAIGVAVVVILAVGATVLRKPERVETRTSASPPAPTVLDVPAPPASSAAATPPVVIPAPDVPPTAKAPVLGAAAGVTTPLPAVHAAPRAPTARPGSPPASPKASASSAPSASPLEIRRER